MALEQPLLYAGGAGIAHLLARYWLLQQFGTQRDTARARYRQYVLEGVAEESPLQAVQHQLLLGDDAFVAAHRDQRRAEELTAIAKVQRRASALTLEQYQRTYRSRDEAMARAYWSTAFTMADIGAYFAVGYDSQPRRSALCKCERTVVLIRWEMPVAQAQDARGFECKRSSDSAVVLSL